jgi:glycosyltransferase involved in cell wall biosynthesis
MAPPLVSIILPTRNRLPTIQRTIERILAQTFRDWELIVSDNASDEEGKVEYLKGVAGRDDRVRAHFQKSNIGIHANWRFCIERIAGRFYIPVTDDDWWGEDHFLETLLSLHDGKTASVFPNMCIHHLDTGEVEERALSPVYAGAVNRYEICERLLRDGRGVVMVGLLDTNVVSKDEIIRVIDNDLAVAIETVGMMEIARKYPVRFCEEVSYHHSAYSGNYARAHESEQLDQDRGIVTFQLLDGFRRAMRADPGFEPVFNLQWERAQSFCCGIASRDQYNPKAVLRAEEQKEKVRALRKELREARADLASLPAALRGWWRERRRQRPSGADRADD